MLNLRISALTAANAVVQCGHTSVYPLLLLSAAAHAPLPPLFAGIRYDALMIKLVCTVCTLLGRSSTAAYLREGDGGNASGAAT